MIKNNPKLIPEGIKIITYFEGCRLKSYQDQAGHWSVGYGHRSGVHPYMQITPAIAEKLLKEDTGEVEAFLHKVLNCELTDNEYSALVSLVYNIGSDAFKMSRLHLYLNANLKPLVADEFLRWVYIKKKLSKGLKARRQAERKLFLKKEKI